MASTQGDGLLRERTVLCNRWRVRRRVGRGTFSEIYEASDLQAERDANGMHPSVAIKVARDAQKCSMLTHEQEVLRDLQGSRYVARYIELGYDANCHYLVMELLGDNISELRRAATSKRLSLRTVMVLGLQTIDAIEHVHETGYIHRDIKPSNFCIGLHDPGRSYLLDFGLARRWKLANGELRPERNTVEFRGTCRYASVHSHQSQDLSRRDDLWSWLYMLMELFHGELPWHTTKDRQAVLQMKLALMKSIVATVPASQNGLTVPDVFRQLQRHIQELNFGAVPDYKRLRALLTSELKPPVPVELDWLAEGVSKLKRRPRSHAPNAVAASPRAQSPATPGGGKQSVSERPEKSTKLERPEKSAKLERLEKAERPAKPERPAERDVDVNRAGGTPGGAEQRDASAAADRHTVAEDTAGASEQVTVREVLLRGEEIRKRDGNSVARLLYEWTGVSAMRVDRFAHDSAVLHFADVRTAAQVVEAVHGCVGLTALPYTPARRCGFQGARPEAPSCAWGCSTPGSTPSRPTPAGGTLGTTSTSAIASTPAGSIASVQKSSFGTTPRCSHNNGASFGAPALAHGDASASASASASAHANARGEELPARRLAWSTRKEFVELGSHRPRAHMSSSNGNSQRGHESSVRHSSGGDRSSPCAVPTAHAGFGCASKQPPAARGNGNSNACSGGSRCSGGNAGSVPQVGHGDCAGAARPAGHAAALAPVAAESERKPRWQAVADAAAERFPTSNAPKEEAPGQPAVVSQPQGVLRQPSPPVLVVQVPTQPSRLPTPPNTGELSVRSLSTPPSQSPNPAQSLKRPLPPPPTAPEQDACNSSDGVSAPASAVGPVSKHARLSDVAGASRSAAAAVDTINERVRKKAVAAQHQAQADGAAHAPADGIPQAPADGTFDAVQPSTPDDVEDEPADDVALPSADSNIAYAPAVSPRESAASKQTAKKHKSGAQESTKREAAHAAPAELDAASVGAPRASAKKGRSVRGSREMRNLIDNGSNLELLQQLEQRAPRSARGKPSLPPEPAPEQEIAQLPQPTTYLGTIFENQADMNAEPCAIASADTAERAASTRSARQLKRAVLPASTDFSPAKNSGSAERVSRELINLLSD